ncbi:phage minor head protein [Actinomadura litoris]|uniref:phage minor head protein n=1 Tax=Actinomadura litoris TaxID=2678616 RepID=UPI001FA704E8|nr:phage minor head protein [Actinomadura litoris]
MRVAFTSRTLGLARAAITAVGRLADAAVRALTAAWVQAWDGLAGTFTTALETLLAGAERWPARRVIEQDRDLRAALDAALRALGILADLTATEAAAAARDAAARAGRDQADIIGSQLPPGRHDHPVRPGGFQQAIDAIQRRAQQRIIALTRPLARDADAAMRRALVRGVTLGKGPRDTAGRMVRQVEGAFNGGLTRALTITRTETLDAYRQAAAAVQDGSRDVLAGWVWLAQLDTRACPACWAMHGTEHPLDEPGPQGHPNCRCSRAPKTQSWRDLGFDLDEPDDAFPNGEAAFRALPRSQQVQIMGRARLALLDDGAVGWRELARRRENPGWRDSYAAIPVRDLSPA